MENPAGPRAVWEPCQDEQAAEALSRLTREAPTSFAGSRLLGARCDAHVPDFDTDFVRGLAETMGLMAAHVETDLPVNERLSFYDRVLADLDRAEEGLGNSIRPYLEQVRTEFDRSGVFERLRRNKEAPADSGS